MTIEKVYFLQNMDGIKYFLSMYQHEESSLIVMSEEAGSLIQFLQEIMPNQRKITIPRIPISYIPPKELFEEQKSQFIAWRERYKNILDEVIPAQIRVRASDNLMWVIASNSSGDYSSWPTCIARPDGSLESLERGVPGILYREFPDDDRTNEFRSWTHNNKMMKLSENEIYHNGIPSRHPRALNTKSLP